MEWQPIETAPKDGRHIWVFDPKTHQCVAFFYQDEYWEGWMYVDELSADISPEGLDPTHWMPLPTPPNAKESNK